MPPRRRHRPDDEPVRAQRDDHRRPGSDRVRAGRDPAILAGGGGALRAREQLDLGSPRVQAGDHGQRRPRARCTSSATTSMSKPARSCAATAGDFDVARIDGKWLITNMVGGTTVSGSLSDLGRGAGAAGRPRGAAADRRSARPRRRPPAGQGSDEAADRVRRHVAAARRGRPARPARPRAVERSRREPRAAPGASGRVRPTPARGASTSASSCRRTLERTSTSSGRMSRPDRSRRRTRSRSICSRSTRPPDRGADDRGSTPVHAASGRSGRSWRDQGQGRSALDVAREEIIPLYGIGAISNEDKDLSEMLPLRAHAERLASHLKQTPRTWRTGRGRRSTS